jgi:hypothetical protein
MKTKLIMAMLLFTVIIALSGCIETLTDGKHNGQITAIEKNGYIWKTTTVYVKSDIISSQEDRYCVEDETLVPLLYNLSQTRERTTLLYRNEAYKAPWRCSMGDIAGIITGVEK